MSSAITHELTRAEILEYIVPGVSPENLTRKQAGQALTRLYCELLTEDPVDGSEFDCAMLDAIEDVTERFSAKS